jgi:hypothetical protein
VPRITPRVLLLATFLAALSGSPVLPAGPSATAAPTGLSATTGLTAVPRARDILPAAGLVASSVVPLPDQAALDAHYFLAEESLLGLGRTTDAVFAKYRTEAGETLLLIVAYPSAEIAERVYRRFGGDFFSKVFEPASPRYVEKIETGDWAGAARKGPVLIVVLEAPDRTSCEGLLGRAEEKAAGIKFP